MEHNNNPPFQRYPIASRHAAPLPTSIRRLPNWESFRHDLDPVALLVQQADTPSISARVLIVGLLISFVLCLVVTPFLKIPLLFTMAGIFFILAVIYTVARPVLHRRKVAQHLRLREVCEKHQAAFAAHGYAVECRFEARQPLSTSRSTSSSSGGGFRVAAGKLCLVFVPLQQ